MNFEIEFHRVGDLTKAGDAITIRYNSDSGYKVIVIDGGTDESGKRIVEHIRTIYGPNTVVSDVISTHPDSDHACGLREVLRELPVERFWIHGLWYHAKEITPLFQDSRWTVAGLREAIRSEYPVIVELFDIAQEKGIPIYEPFAGLTIGPFTVLSPNKPTYQHLIPQFRRTPTPNREILKQRGIWLGDETKMRVAAGFFTKSIEKITKWVADKWDLELLKEGGITAAENETSTVLFGDFGKTTILLTADAGVSALTWAADYADKAGLNLKSTALVQVPHHGSRRNVSPSVLDRIVGPKLPPGSPPIKKAIVSAPKDDEKHPRKIVLNA
jgi:beta-lactamase superfamily II metal-dependent hydrolase